MFKVIYCVSIGISINQRVDLEAFHFHLSGGTNPQSINQFLLMCAVGHHAGVLSLLGHKLVADHLMLGIDYSHIFGIILLLPSGGDLHIHAEDHL